MLRFFSTSLAGRRDSPPLRHPRNSGDPSPPAPLSREAGVGGLHQELTRCPVQANLVRSVLSKMMTLAEQWELRPDGTSPTRHVERYPSRRRKRHLSAEARS